MKPKPGRLWTELVGGLIAVTLLSGLATYGCTLHLARRDFDDMVAKTDIAIAKDFASVLADHYGRNGSWEGVEDAVKAPRSTPNPYLAREKGDKPDHGKPRDDVPLILTDERGRPVFFGFQERKDKDGRVRKHPEKLDTALGEAVRSNGSVVGYVFFKSMFSLRYDPREEAFFDALTSSIGASVLFGILLSLVLGTILTTRFTRPLATLEAAVRTIADGDLKARVRIDRKDEIGSLAGNFNLMADRLEADETSRRNLIADVAHELRTPVSVIQANLEMILDGVYAADKERIRSLYDETRILTRLIADLRSLSDIELGIAPAEIEELDLGSLIFEASEKFRPLYAGKRIELRFEQAGEKTLVRADRERLRQVMRNILENALKYSPEGSSVTISAERQERDGKGVVRAAVSDEGPGVPEIDLEKIFERFYRVDQSRNRVSGGRGLGLALCKQFVEACGGSIGARNRSPHGLEVFFVLDEV